jgi:hypothetical protein
LSSQKVRALAAAYVPLRLDEIADAARFEHYGVDGIGVFLVADLDGEILDEVPMRELDPEPMTEAFIATLGEFLEQWPALQDARAGAGEDGGDDDDDDDE